MKKLFYMISTVALMASFASCNKIEQGNTPAETPSVDGTTTLTVSATVPQTKTYMNKGKTLWTKGDIVTLLAEDGVSAVSSNEISGAVETSDFIFNNWPSAVTPKFLVFNGPLAYDEENYGGNKVMAPVLNEDGTITAEVRKHQEIVNRSNFSKYANLSIGKLEVESSLYTAEMKNVCGLIKVKTTKEDPLEYIKIENLGESYITGVVKVDYNNGEPRVVEVLNGSKEVKLTSHISDTDDKLPASTYYACVLPGTYTPKVIMKPVGGDEVALTAKLPVTIERNKIMDFGTIDNILTPDPDQPGAGEGGDETLETLDITVEMPYPFTSNLPTSTGTKTKDTYTLKDTDYTFVLYNPNEGYYLTNSCLRLSKTAGKSGYIQFPALPGYALIGFEITSGNGTNKKDYYVYAQDPIEVTTGNESLAHITLTNETPVNVTLSGTSAGVGYFLESHSTNAQFRKLILTYAKVK